MRVRHPLVDADEGAAEPLAAMREYLPVSQMKSADDEWLRALRCSVEVFRGLEDDAVALRQRLDAKALGEGPAEIFPHRRGDRLAFFGRFLGKGQFEICERALLSAKARGDQAPEHSREPRRRLHRHGARNDDRQPEAREFQPKTQIFGKFHEKSDGLDTMADFDLMDCPIASPAPSQPWAGRLRRSPHRAPRNL